MQLTESIPAESIPTAQQFLESLQALPIGVHAAALIGLVAGLSLWIAGRKIVKPVFLLLGLALSAVGGFFIAPLSGLDTIYGYPSPYIGLGLGALFGLAASAFLFRFTMAIASGGSVAIASCLGAAVYLNAYPTVNEIENSLGERAGLALGDLALDQVPIVGSGDSLNDGHPDAETTGFGQDGSDDGFGDQFGEAGGDGDGGEGAMANVARNAANRVREFMGHLGSELGLIWDQLPLRDRSVIASSGLVGAFFGALIGLVMPKRASALFTSLFGAAIWMPCLFWLLTAIDAPIGFMGAMSAKAWLIAWAVLSLVGTSIQWSGLATRKRRSSEDDDDDDD